MASVGKSPFDDASGQQLLEWLAAQGGVGSRVQEYTAAGTTIADATETTLGSVYVTTTAASTGIKLFNSVAVGQSVLVYNGGASTLRVYPPTVLQNINDEAAGDPVTILTLGTKTFTRISDLLWIESSGT